MKTTYDGSGEPSMSNDVDEGLISNLMPMTKDVSDTCVGGLVGGGDRQYKTSNILRLVGRTRCDLTVGESLTSVTVTRYSTSWSLYKNVNPATPGDNRNVVIV